MTPSSATHGENTLRPTGRLPDGVVLRSLVTHRDRRGELTELFRSEWVADVAFNQWNIVRSDAGVMRGVHVHPRHSDYLHVVAGTLVLGLHDLRPADPARCTSCMVTLAAADMTTVFIPAGVCHGFWCPEPTTYLYGLSSGWAMSEEFGCRYDDAALGLDWNLPVAPMLSPRDTTPACDYHGMRQMWFSMRAQHERDDA